MLYGKAECPVCADSGSLIALKRKETGAFVFYCPLCGTAFRGIPQPYQLEEVLSLEQIAPDGVVVPSLEEIEASRLELEPLDD